MLQVIFNAVVDIWYFTDVKFPIAQYKIFLQFLPTTNGQTNWLSMIQLHYKLNMYTCMLINIE